MRRTAGAGIVGLWLLAMIGSDGFAAGQASRPAENPWRFGSGYLKGAAADFKEIFSAPARWEKADWAVFAALAGAGGLLFAFDGELYDAVQKSKTPGSVDASGVISKFGNGGFLAGFMGLLYASGEIFDERPLRRTALLCLESFIATGAIVWAGKTVVGRARPIAGLGPSAFRPFSARNAHHSFPSGDASAVFAVASVIAAESDSPVVDALAYGMAGLAAVWRVHDRKHWPADVFVGSVLGIVIGRKVVSLHRGGGGGLGVSIQTGRNPFLGLRFSF